MLARHSRSQIRTHARPMATPSLNLKFLIHTSHHIFSSHYLAGSPFSPTAFGSASCAIACASGGFFPFHLWFAVRYRLYLDSYRTTAPSCTTTCCCCSSSGRTRSVGDAPPTHRSPHLPTPFRTSLHLSAQQGRVALAALRDTRRSESSPTCRSSWGSCRGSQASPKAVHGK